MMSDKRSGGDRIGVEGPVGSLRGNQTEAWTKVKRSLKMRLGSCEREQDEGIGERNK